MFTAKISSEHMCITNTFPAVYTITKCLFWLDSAPSSIKLNAKQVKETNKRTNEQSTSYAPE